MAMNAKDALTHYRQQASRLAPALEEFQKLSDAEKFELLFYTLMATNNRLIPLLESMGIEFSTSMTPLKAN